MRERFSSVHSLTRSFIHSLTARVLCVVGVAAYFPEVRLEGRLAAGLILLRLEGLLVGADVHQVGLASLNGCRYGSEASASQHLVLRRSGTTGDGLQVAQENAVALGTRGRSGTVRTQNHLLVCRMGRLFVDLGQSAAHRCKHRI